MEKHSKILETAIEQKEWLPETCKKLDKELLALLENERYDFHNPKIILNPYKHSPLTAMALFQTENPSYIEVTVKGDKEDQNVTGKTGVATNHMVPIVGLYGGRDNKVELTLYEEGSKIPHTNEITITTEPLPKRFRDLVRIERSCGNSAYGLTLVSGKNTPFPFAFDTSGAVRWYLKKYTAGYGLFLLSGSRFLLPEKNVFVQTEEKPHTTHMYEADYLGRVYKVYRVEKGYHHDVAEMTPGGNLLALSNTIGGHVEDSVVEIDRKTGNVIKTLRLESIFGKTFYNRPNWVHLNTASYNANTDTVLLSARNIHSGVKINWKTNELVWILCNPLFMKDTEFYDKVLKPKGAITWHYQQHTVYEVDADLDGDPNTKHVILFDNHWHRRRRVSFFDGNEETSYVTLYHINEEEMTVSQGNQYEGVKSKITSNSALAFDKKRVFYMGGYLEPLINGRKAMIYEFDYDTKEVMNQYSLKYFFYRAHEFKFDLSDLSNPLPVKDRFIYGNLRHPATPKRYKFRFWKNIPKLSKVTTTPLPDEAEVTFQVRGWELHLNAQDHKVKGVLFFGNNHTYEYDLSETKQTEDVFRKLHYAMAIPLDEMERDTYQIVVNLEGNYYLAKDGFTIR